MTSFNPTVCTQGDLRLVGGTNNHTGRLEICNLNQWGTVCDDFFYLVSARVACRQLGFSDAGTEPKQFSVHYFSNFRIS